jgi:hypothetical protein
MEQESDSMMEVVMTLRKDTKKAVATKLAIEIANPLQPLDTLSPFHGADHNQTLHYCT